MLSYLGIRNFGIFADATVELAPGFSVFTGETGAGKSMIVDAVMACLGQRTPRDFIRFGEERAILELVASVPPDGFVGLSDPAANLVSDMGEVIFQKDILADRSTLRVNGRLATQVAAQEIGSRLVDIHGQQEHHSLLRPQNHLGVLDSLRRDVTGPLVQAFASMYEKMKALRQRAGELGLGDEERRREMDLLGYQVREIEDASPRMGEEEELREEHTLLSAQERLILLAEDAYGALYESEGSSRAAAELIQAALGDLRRAEQIDPSSKNAVHAVEQVSFMMEAALDTLREYREQLFVDPDRMRVVSDRLDTLAFLKSKYGGSISAVIEFCARARERLSVLEQADETLASLEAKMSETAGDMAKMGQRLTAARREIAEEMERSVTGTLGELGMPGAAFKVDMGLTKKAHSRGFDEVTFLFSANPGEPAMALHRVASGGELSRLMLAVKAYMEESDPVPTLVFDEIDAGIGGRTGQAVARTLKRLGASHQVLSVTHLATIAAAATNHYLVSKEEVSGRTLGRVRQLHGEERVAEISRMLGGLDAKVSMEHARELMKASQG